MHFGEDEIEKKREEEIVGEKEKKKSSVFVPNLSGVISWRVTSLLDFVKSLFSRPTGL